MNEIVKMMIGREIGERYPKRDCAIGDEVFRVEGLTKEGVFRDVDFSVKAGEVLGGIRADGSGGARKSCRLFSETCPMTEAAFLSTESRR